MGSQKCLNTEGDTEGDDGCAAYKGCELLRPGSGGATADHPPQVVPEGQGNNRSSAGNYHRINRSSLQADRWLGAAH